MESFSMEKPTPEEKEKMRSRISSLIEFLEMNNIPPYEAMPMFMKFIASVCKGHLPKELLVAMFEKMVDAVNNSEE